MNRINLYVTVSIFKTQTISSLRINRANEKISQGLGIHKRLSNITLSHKAHGTVMVQPFKYPWYLKKKKKSRYGTLTNQYTKFVLPGNQDFWTQSLINTFKANSEITREVFLVEWYPGLVEKGWKRHLPSYLEILSMVGGIVQKWVSAWNSGIPWAMAVSHTLVRGYGCGSG